MQVSPAGAFELYGLLRVTQAFPRFEECPPTRPTESILRGPRGPFSSEPTREDGRST